MRVGYQSRSIYSGGRSDHPKHADVLLLPLQEHTLRQLRQGHSRNLLLTHEAAPAARVTGTRLLTWRSAKVLAIARSRAMRNSLASIRSR